VLGIFVGVLRAWEAERRGILLPLTFTMDPTSAIVMLSCIYWGPSSARDHFDPVQHPGEPGRWRPPSTGIRWRSREGGRGADRRVHLFVHRVAGRGAADHFLAPGMPPSRCASAARVLRRLFPHVLLLRRPGPREKHKTIISSRSACCSPHRHGHVSGQLRMTFGSDNLLRGINFLVASSACRHSEILLTMEERLALRGHAARSAARRLQVWRELPRYWATLLRSSAIGCGWASPREAPSRLLHGLQRGEAFLQGQGELRQGTHRRRVRTRDRGARSGTAALLPMLALGIPLGHGGDPARRADGMGPESGPLLFVEHKDFVWD